MLDAFSVTDDMNIAAPTKTRCNGIIITLFLGLNIASG